ncbi:DUF2007 domain-containing protein [Lysobacter sp. Root690]|uniref:putative signal transducing protein n=1 Tax=Lysobacter sp. Root690 TaxID=1736588 RepID=UPI0006FC1203|nr:DUF2007 domain-containing protein [Lysobacter sp. Root690]KRB06184.1 hypothetical protein ASD86_15535 [Lysobacter sp. Root690]
MKVVYEAAHLIDAHLVRHALEDAGIPVFLRGEALLGGIGELPAFGAVQVCVPHAAWPRAREVVEALSLGDPPPEVADEPDPVGGLPPTGWLPA